MLEIEMSFKNIWLTKMITEMYDGKMINIF